MAPPAENISHVVDVFTGDDPEYLVEVFIANFEKVSKLFDWNDDDNHMGFYARAVISGTAHKWLRNVCAQSWQEICRELRAKFKTQLPELTAGKHLHKTTDQKEHADPEATIVTDGVVVEEGYKCSGTVRAPRSIVGTCSEAGERFKEIADGTTSSLKQLQPTEKETTAEKNTIVENVCCLQKLPPGMRNSDLFDRLVEIYRIKHRVADNLVPLACRSFEKKIGQSPALLLENIKQFRIYFKNYIPAEVRMLKAEYF